MNRKTFLFLALILFVIYSFSQLSNQQSNEAVVFNKESPPKILMLSTQSCRYCKQARQFFKQHELPYTELDIETSDKNMQMFQLLGGRGTPLIVIDGQSLHGFDERSVRRAIKESNTVSP